MEGVFELVKERTKESGRSLAQVAAHLGIQYQTLFKTLNHAPKIGYLKRIADFIGCDLHELIPTGSRFEHYYQDKKEWKGIRPKAW